MSEPIEVSSIVTDANSAQKPSHILSQASGLSQAKLKDAMQKGAVWLVRGGKKQRLRRASKSLQVGDELQLFYNASILQQVLVEPLLIADLVDYSVWFKPYGVYCQGSRWGDFCAINRWVEQYYVQSKDEEHSQRPAFLVHRLDRATSGLILLAHTKNAARAFSQLFTDREMDKRYQAIVVGDFSSHTDWLRVEQEVDGKTAASLFQHVAFDGSRSLVDVQLLSGRKHQIRQHLSSIGFPIAGDRLYGRGEQDGVDLQLQSTSLAFECPLTHQTKYFDVPSRLRLEL